MSDELATPISAYERRRRAPLHFAQRAENARFSSYVLWNALEARDVSALADASRYGGAPSIALREAFNREASIAIELVIKSVIAQRLEVGEDLGQTTKVPANHNVPQLWSVARLPRPPIDDYGRLVVARVNLTWAARYPAPNRDADGERDNDDLYRHATERVGNFSIDIRKRRSFNWEDVNRIYQIASNCFWDIRKANDF